MTRSQRRTSAFLTAFVVICVLVTLLLLIYLRDWMMTIPNHYYYKQPLYIDDEQVMPTMNYSFKHPTPLDQLWVLINKYFVIRNLAYYDATDKSDIGIVFIGMHDMKVKNKLPELYVQLRYDHNEIFCINLKYQKMIGRLSSTWSQYWVSYILRTEFKLLAKKPVVVRISTSNQCNNLTKPIPIQGDTSEKTYTFGVCLHQPLFDVKDPQVLLNWVELNLVLGAEIITIYFQNVPESFYEILKPYVIKGLVEILDWNLKPPILSGFTETWGQVGLMNECIYRNLYRVKYLALMDIDEFIIPQNKNQFKITEILPTIEKLNHNAAAYTFLHTHFISDGVALPEVNMSVKCLRMSWPRYFTQTLRSSDPVGDGKRFPNHKLIVKPKAVIAVDVHSIAAAKRGYTPNYIVPVNVGLLFHFRYGARFNIPKKERTFIMSQYFNQTFQRLKSKIC